MEQMHRAHHVVVVRNSVGRVVHTHEVIEFEGVPSLSEEQLLDEGVAAAARVLRGAHGDELTPATSTTEELEGIRGEGTDSPNSA
jgi:hypothetical protein